LAISVPKGGKRRNYAISDRRQVGQLARSFAGTRQRAGKQMQPFHDAGPFGFAYRLQSGDELLVRLVVNHLQLAPLCSANIRAAAG